MRYFLSVLGMALVLEGLPYFAFPEKVKEFLAKVLPLSDSKLRILGLGVIALGLFLLYVAREMS